MANEAHYGGKGHWAGPATAVVLIVLVLIMFGWFEIGMLHTLMNG